MCQPYKAQLHNPKATLVRCYGPLRIFTAALQTSSQAVGWIATVLLMSLVGCQTLSLPAIDPTGNRIFTNGATQLINPHDPNNGYPSTQPAFQTPPEPPPCMQGANGSERKLCKGCLAGKGCLARKKDAEEIRGRCGQLLLTPTRIVAPVGGEVILLAGICGKDEYLVTNEPIEWMLSPSSVGEIVEVADDTKGQRQTSWKRDNSPRVEKLDVDFARGRTSREAGRITRGTSNPADDLPIRKGQTWISLTSSSEGTSKVTALAPDSDVWDKRRQTATIYWVDASWALPQPQFAKTGDPVNLATRVYKAEGFSPAEGWKVRYRVADQSANFAKLQAVNAPPNAFADNVEVTVDSNGLAPVNAFNGGANGEILPFGTAIIEIEIVRPRLSENMPEISVGRGAVPITWSAPALAMEAGGPEVATPGQSLPYFANLRNIGDISAENVELSVAIPTGMQFESSNYPPERTTNNVLTWPIAALQARHVFELRFNLVASAPLDGSVQIRATGSPNLGQQKSLPIIIQKPQLLLQVAPDPNRGRVEVGNETSFTITLTNTGNQTLNNLTLAIKSDQGLQHAGDGQNLVSREIAFINPGQNVSVPAVFNVQREGELSIEASVQTLGQAIATQRASIIGLQPTPKRPSVQVQIAPINASNSVPVGSEFDVMWDVTNNGTVPLRNVVVLMQHDQTLEPRSLSNGGQYKQAQQLVEWSFPVLAPNSNLRFESRFRATTEMPRANIVVGVTTADQVSDQKTLPVQIGIGNGGNAGGNTGGNDILPNGPNGRMNKPSLLSDGETDPKLCVSIRPVTNAIKKGDIATYEIRIDNLRNKADQRVALQVLRPEGSSLVSIRAKELKYKLSNEDRQIDFEPIQYFRPSDSFSYVLQLKHDVAGTGEIVASVTSKGQANPATNRLTVQVSP